MVGMLSVAMSIVPIYPMFSSSASLACIGARLRSIGARGIHRRTLGPPPTAVPTVPGTCATPSKSAISSRSPMAIDSTPKIGYYRILLQIASVIRGSYPERPLGASVDSAIVHSRGIECWLLRFRQLSPSPLPSMRSIARWHPWRSRH